MSSLYHCLLLLDFKQRTFTACRHTVRLLAITIHHYAVHITLWNNNNINKLPLILHISADRIYDNVPVSVT